MIDKAAPREKDCGEFIRLQAELLATAEPERHALRVRPAVLAQPAFEGDIDPRLDATTGTPAAVTPASMTFTYAFLHEGTPFDLVFGPRHRKVPVRLRIFPYSNAGLPAYFTAT